ncbi:BTAD domain-containing putative transcriptional regulator [Nocardia sp. NPDC020380]|uniref:BTAD domain-containing putative transcriptional regulator n=1 Tax=Nocardia sp. NPDC020380 TaxID=3364309 RepID=UPI003797FA70
MEIRSDDGGSVEVPGTRLRALVIALGLEPGRAVSKAKLVDWIWGEQPPADAANALQALVSRLRRALPAGSIEVQAGGYRLTVAPEAVDAVRFEQLVDQARDSEDLQRARLLRAALELWRGTAMQDIELPENAAFEAVVTRFEALHLSALEDRYEVEIRLGRGPQVVTELTELVARHPVRERLVAALIRALAAAGRGTEALTVYQRAREALADELGVDPSPELSALHVSLLRGELGVQQQEDRKTNLRAELTTFVGKQDDVAAVRKLVGEHRLTTVSGPGGSGKTRLALETARTLLGELPDGAWLVELSSVGVSADIAQSALAALGLRDALLGGTADAEPIDRLVAAIREREMLLILDNCEHVIESAAAFAHRVLGECRQLRILATSREPLGITGEALWQVEPLALPAAAADAGAIESSPAVQLLRDRAGAVRKDLVADAQTLSSMARICRALDGIPLAIELAAARLRTMSLEQLANRLDDRFRLLTGGSRTALPQHRTLRAVVDWSWELLTEPEKIVLRRLSVFAGGAGLDAAEQVCAGAGYGDDGSVEQWEVLELLTSLTEKSLLSIVGDGGPRFRMLETIKEYSRDRLAEAGESEAARAAHLAYFTGFAATAEPHLRRAEQLEWLAALEVEHDNIAAAMRGAVAAGDGAGAMGLAAQAGWYWWLGGRKAEGMELITAATGTPGEADADALATVYGMVVHFLSTGPSDEHQVGEWIAKAYEFSLHSRSAHPAQQFVVALKNMMNGPDAVLPAFEPLLTDPDPWVQALARLLLGKMRIVLGQQGRDADEYLETALAEFRGLGERWGISFALTETADRIAVRGEFAAAIELFEQAIAVVTEVGAVEDLIRMRSRQAQLHWLLGDAEASAAAMAEAQHGAERVAWPNTLAELALAKAELARWQGDNAEAHRQLGIATGLLDLKWPNIRAMNHDLLGYLADSVEAAREHRVVAFEAASEAGHAPLIARVIVGIADLALREEQYERAAQLLAAADVARGLPDRSQPDIARIEQETRNRLGEPEFTEAMRAGAQSSWHELVSITLAC